MVQIAIAGGSGEVAREVIDALTATRKHEITILSRNLPKAGDSTTGVKWLTVDYDDKGQIVEALREIHTLLSFIQDPENKVQKNMIDAAIITGVRRFAPSEWGSSGIGIPLWAGKAKTREYLQKVNAKGKVLEYTLFQPGLFLNYLATPHKTAEHLYPLNTMVDFQNRRAIVVDGVDAVMTLTTVQDLAEVVARAVDLDGEWPTIGGVRGNRVTISQILEIGEKVRGRPFTIDKVKLEDLENGTLTASWTLEASHPSFRADKVAATLKAVLIGTLVSSAKGAWAGSDEFNQLLPEYKFTQIEDFLAGVWEGKP